MRSLWARLGLRSRITLLFALGGLLLSVTIVVSTLTIARESLVNDREDRSLAVVLRNADRVASRLTDETDPEALAVVFDALTITDRSLPLLRFNESWTAGTPLAFSEENVPVALVEQVQAGFAARIRTRLGDKPAIVTGIPMPGIDAAYYEAALTNDVEETLNTLTIILTAVSAATTMLAAGLGSWASRRTLTPLADFREAAESLAAGALDTRLTPPADTDLASLSASFNGMAQSLEDRISRDGRFALEVSHELRSPLMTLSASIEVLNNSRDDFSSRNQTALDLLTDDVDRFTVLVKDLLEISRYDVGTASLDAEPLDVVEFVRQVVAHSPYPDARIDADDLEYLLIQGDKRRLAQVVANLLDNAAKYGAGQTRVELRGRGEWISLAVEDEGPGVNPDERNVIFDRFSRGSAGGRRGAGSGSGLGLSLVAEHVGLHNGQIWVEDRSDGASGARFVVMLPVGELDDLGEDYV